MTPPRVLYVATSNPGKLRDFSLAAERFSTAHEETRSNFTLQPLPNLASLPAPAEDAETFEGNARLKAIYYSQHAPGALVLADDSGLEVDALDGAPGVYSARYAARAAVPSAATTADARNNQHLLEELARTLAPQGMLANLDRRAARYRCVLAVARDCSVLATAEGATEGLILLQARGNEGFGYDPLFYLPQLEQTMAELDPRTRLELSHRGRALRILLPQLATLFP